MRDYLFSDAQALSTLDSTGVVSSNVFDMELAASGGAAILTNDQLVGVLNVRINSSTNTVAGGTEGMDILLLSNDNADMTTGTEVELARIHLTYAEIVTGTIKNVAVCTPLTQCFVGVWYKATSTSLDGATAAEAWMDIAPVTANDSIQKVPA